MSCVTGKAFTTSSYVALSRTGELILDVNVRGEEERKRTDFASFMKRADVLSHLNCVVI